MVTDTPKNEWLPEDLAAQNQADKLTVRSLPKEARRFLANEIRRAVSRAKAAGFQEGVKKGKAETWARYMAYKIDVTIDAYSARDKFQVETLRKELAEARAKLDQLTRILRPL